MLKRIKNKINKKEGIKDKVENKANDETLTVTNQIHIKIYRDIGGGSLGLSAKFMATEKKDDYNNLFAIAEDKQFKEDLDFNKDRIYDWLLSHEKINNKKRPDQIKALDEMVKNQNDLINNINSNPEENANYNFLDEEEKLNQIKIIREYRMKISEQGTYMTQEGGGIRTFYFKLIDGLLFPYWWGKNSMRVDPDLTVAKKTYVQENNIFNTENADKLKKAINWAGIIMLGFGIVLTLVNIYFAFSHNEEIYSMAKDVNQGTITCTNTLALCTQNYEKLSSQYNLGITNSENIIKDEKQSTNNPLNNLVKVDK